MIRCSLALSVAVLLALVQPAAAVVFYSQNFNANDGGYTTATVNPPGAGPWTYGAFGTGGSNAWQANGGETGGYPTPLPFEQLLTSPVIAVGPVSGGVSVEFDHLYNFELNGGIWDGGVVMVNKNGGGFNPVPASAFTANGYRGPLQSDADWGYAGDLNGVDVFSGSSGFPGQVTQNPDTGVFVHSVANLGFFNAGDTVQLQFRGGWDWFATFTPGWAVDNVSLEVVPEPSSLAMLVGLAGVGILACLRRRRRN